eukprot:365377-Chlamydomonas_euryale.AAC.16
MHADKNRECALTTRPALAHGFTGIDMRNKGHKHLLGMPCQLEVELSGDSKYRPCQDLEVISEAMEVIYAFAVGLEPDEVAVTRVGCNSDGINVSIGFTGSVTNSTLSSLMNDGPPKLMASTLSPFGLSLKGTTIIHDVYRQQQS